MSSARVTDHTTGSPVGHDERHGTAGERVGHGLGSRRELPERDLEHVVGVELAHDPGELGVGETRDEEREPLSTAVVGGDSSAAKHAHERADDEPAAEAERDDDLERVSQAGPASGSCDFHSAERSVAPPINATNSPTKTTP